MIKINDKSQIEISPVLAIVQNGEISKFTTVVTLRDIAEVYDRLTYDGAAQRGYKIKKVGDGKSQKEVKEGLVESDHVESIKSAFLEGEDVRGHLTWNIRTFEDIDDLNLDYYEYDSVKNTLTITGNTITLPDSAHRHRAIYEIFKENKYDEALDNELGLDIYSLNFEDEKQLFVDINSKGKPPHRNRILALSNDVRCELLRDVIRNSDLNDRVEMTGRNAKGNGLLKFQTLHDSLFGKAESGVYRHIEITQHNYNEYKDWLIRFYNELLKTRPEFSFNNTEERNEYKKDNMVVEELSWWSYAYMAKQLKGKSSWKSMLNSRMNKKIFIGNGVYVDVWSKGNTIWHGGILLYKFNHAEQKVEVSKNVHNTNATKRRIQDIVAIQLFS